jgi:hypothetical protein
MEHGSGLKNPPAVKFEPWGAFFEAGINSPKPSWLVPGLVPVSGWAMLAGPPGCGKTWLALATAKAAIAAGRQVFLFENEGSKWGLANRGKLMSIPMDAPMRVAFRTGFQIDERPSNTALCEAMLKHKNPVLLMDPLQNFWSGDENLAKDAARLVRALNTVLSIPGALLETVHHTSKGGFDEGRTAVYAVRGSSVLPAAADCVLNISKTESTRGFVSMVVDPVKSRDLEEPGRRKLVIELGTGVVSLTNEWEERRTGKWEEIQDALAGGPLTRNEIFKIVKGTRGTVLGIIAERLSAGLLFEDSGRVSIKNGVGTGTTP